MSRAYVISAVCYGAFWVLLLLIANWASRPGRLFRVGRALERHLDRKSEQAQQEIADPLLALHRGHRPLPREVSR